MPPDWMPSMEGEAMGVWYTLWHTAPQTARQAPTTATITTV